MAEVRVVRVERLRLGGIRRRVTGGIEGDMMGEILGRILDEKPIRTVGGPAVAILRASVKRVLRTATSAYARARQIVMRMRTVTRGGDARAAQSRLAAIQACRVSVRQDVGGAWVPLVYVARTHISPMKDVLAQAGYIPVVTNLGRGWLTVER